MSSRSVSTTYPYKIALRAANAGGHARDGGDETRGTFARLVQENSLVPEFLREAVGSLGFLLRLLPQKGSLLVSERVKDTDKSRNSAKNS